MYVSKIALASFMAFSISMPLSLSVYAEDAPVTEQKEVLENKESAEIPEEQKAEDTPVKEEDKKPERVAREKPDFSGKSGNIRKRYEQRYTEMDVFDNDGDGAVDIDEMKAKGEAQLTEMDVNGDGVVSVSEIDEYTAKYQQDVAADPDNELGSKSIEIRARELKRKLLRMDIDENGQITADEVATYQEKLLEKQDKDGDGKLDISEYRAQTERKKRRK